MGTKVNSNYESLLTFTRASKGHALRPVSYGAELVTNGDFSSTDLSDWTKGTGWSISGGQATHVAGTGSNISQSVSYGSAGTIYALSVDVVSISGGSGSIQARSGGATTAKTIDGNTSGTTVTLIYVHDGLNTDVAIYAGAGTSLTIDNVSVKEVLFDQPDGTLTLFEHPNNVPRVEWDADRNRLGLLVEEQRINLVTQSENFGASVWNVSAAGITVIADAIAAPDGTMTADKLQEASSTDNHRRGFAISGSNDKIFSFFAKAGERTKVRTWSFPGGNTQAATFDLSEGAVVDGSSAGKEAKIEDYGNDWYRCSVKVDGNQTAVVVGPMIDGISGASTATYTGDGSSGVYVWGAQIEDNVSFPTSYIKSNSGSTTTRSADVASIPVADFGYNQSVWSVVVVGQSYEPGFDNYFFEMSKDSSNRNFVKCANGQHLIVTSGGVTQAILDAGEIAANTEAKLAVSVQADDFAASLDGGAVVTDTSGTTNLDVTDLKLGMNRSNGEHLNGHIKSIQYYPRRLTNAQLVDLTS